MFVFSSLFMCFLCFFLAMNMYHVHNQKKKCLRKLMKEIDSMIQRV